jgi:hypothetical protein
MGERWEDVHRCVEYRSDESPERVCGGIWNCDDGLILVAHFLGEGDGVLFGGV